MISATVTHRRYRPQARRRARVGLATAVTSGIFYAHGVKANVLFFDRKPAADKQAWTTKLWIYDLRTNLHFTLKENPLKRADLDDFVACWFGKVEEASRLLGRKDKRRDAASTLTLTRHERVETERFKPFTYEELTKRDKANLDIFWLKDESLEDSANLPAPDVLAAEDLEAALAQFATIAEDLRR